MTINPSGAKRLKGQHRRYNSKSPLRSFARSLALTPGHELHAMTPERVALVQAARDWLANKGVPQLKAVA
jgi:hypothetical protein